MPAIGIALGNTLEGWSASFFSAVHRISLSMDRLRDVMGLELCIELVATLVSGDHRSRQPMHHRSSLMEWLQYFVVDLVARRCHGGLLGGSNPSDWR